MWRFLNSIPRAFRQHVLIPRPSVGGCVEEEKADHETVAEQCSDKDTQNVLSGHKEEGLCCWRRVLLKRKENEGGSDIPGNGLSTSGQNEGGEWWQFCHQNFWKIFQDSQNRMLEAVSLGSYMLWGSEENRRSRKARLLHRVLFLLPGIHTGRLGIKDQILEGTPSSITPVEFNVQMAIKDAAGAAHDAKVNKSRVETLDSALQEFQTMCTEYTACTQSLLGLQAAGDGNMSTAVEHLRSSCMLGNVSACFNLGLCYETGAGVTQDLDKAEHYYQIAAKKGHTLAMFNLALMYLGKNEPVDGDGVENASGPAEGLILLENAATLGLAEAQTYLGIHYMEERQDPARALPYFRAAAQQNDKEAQYFLAVCYEHGIGVDVNECRAAQLYSLAACAGHETALYNLAVFNENGLGGLPEDEDNAVELYRKAADLGSKEAAERLEEIMSSRKDSIQQENVFHDLRPLCNKDRSSAQYEPLIPSSSTPNLSYQPSWAHIFPHEVTTKYGSYHDRLFDPGGDNISEQKIKIRFHIGDSLSEIEDNSTATSLQLSAAAEAGVFHRSSTMPNLNMIACQV